MGFRWSGVQIPPARPTSPSPDPTISQLMDHRASREPLVGSERLRGAAVWAAYGAVEALFAIMVRRALFGWTYVPPDDRYTLFLLVLYPLAGALLGRFAVYGLAIAFV